MGNFTPLILSPVPFRRVHRRRGLWRARHVVGVFLVLIGIGSATLWHHRPQIMGEFASATKPTGPVLYWKFNERRGTTINDSSTQANPGTNSGGDIAVEEFCVEGRCLYFDGSSSDDAIRSYSSDTELNPGTGNFAVSVWFKHVPAISGTQDYLLSRYAGGGYRIYMTSSGNMCFGVDDDSSWGPDFSACTTGTYNDNRWYHLSAVRSGTTLLVYINGRQVATATTSGLGSLSGTNPTFSVSADGSGNDAWHGWVDELRVYGYDRTKAQVVGDFRNLGAFDVLQAGIAPEFRGSVASGLVGYWPMDETAANSCTGGVNDSCDASGSGNDAAWNGNTTFVFPMRFYYGTTLDGTDDNITVADNATVSPTSGVTLAAWIYPAAVNSRAIIAKNNSFRMTTNAAGFLQCQIYTGGAWQTATVSDTALIPNTQAHVACTYDGLSVVVYINGSRAGLDDLTGAINDSADNLVFGEDSSGTFADYSGRLDDVRLYNRGMTEDEIMNLFDWGPGAELQYDLDEGSGTTANDASGNAYNATFSGNTAWTNGRLNKGLMFDGSEDYITYTDTGTNLIETNTSFSVSAWIKPAATLASNTGQFVVGKIADPGTTPPRENFVLFLQNTDEFSCGFVNTSNSWQYQSSSGVNYVPGNWYHVSCVFDDLNDKLTVYVNGVENAVADDITTSPTSAVSTGNFLIGGSPLTMRNSSNQYLAGDFQGSVDEVKVFRYPLSGKQVQREYNKGQSIGGMNNGPMGYWTFEESAQSDAVGTGTSSNPLVYNSGTYGTRLNGSRISFQFDGSLSGYYKAGVVGTGMQFRDTSDDRVNITSDSALDNLNIFTITAWIHPYSYGENNLGVIFSKSSTTTAMFDFHLLNSGGEAALRFYRRRDTADTTVVSQNNAIPLNQWTHVAIVYNSAFFVRMYINGEEVAYTTRTLGSGDLTSDAGNTAYLGGTNSDENFNGIMDEVKIYSYTLSQREILADYNAGAAITVGGNGPVITPNPTVTPQSQIGTDGAYYNYCIPGDSTFCYGPVHEWRLERIGTSTTIADTAGRFANFDAINNGGTTQTRNGRYGYAFDFDGINDYLDLQDIGGASGLDAATFSMWFRPDVTYDSSTTTSAGLMYERSSTSNNMHLMIRGTDYVSGTCCTSGAGTLVFKNEVGGNDAFVATTRNSWTANTWYHVAVTNDGTTYRIYVNGILEGSSTTNGGNNMFSVIGDVNVGRVDTENDTSDGGAIASGPIRYFDGIIDEIYVFDYARSASQIKYEAYKGKPQGHYLFDECNPSTTTIYDSSGNMNHGTYYVATTGTSTSAGYCTSGVSSHAWEIGRHGRFNSAASFDGSVNGPSPVDEHIRLPVNIYDRFNEGTVSMWIRPQDAGDQYNTLFGVAEQDGNAYSDAIFMTFDTVNDRFEFYALDNGTLILNAVTSAITNTTNWIHVAFRMSNPGGLAIYLNGDPLPLTFITGTASTVIWFNNVSDNTTNYTIGCIDADAGLTNCNEDEMYQGLIDDLRIYDYPVTETQLKSIFNGGASFRYGPVNERAE